MGFCVLDGVGIWSIVHKNIFQLLLDNVKIKSDRKKELAKMGAETLRIDPYLYVRIMKATFRQNILSNGQAIKARTLDYHLATLLLLLNY